MRRLWAYIILAVTSIALVAVSFGGIFAKTTSNIQFQDGREITFRISDKENEDAELEEGAAEEIADEMIRRLELAKVSQYELQIQGEDTIKLILSQETSSDYARIATYLSFNGSLALSNYDTYILPDAFIQEGKDAFIDDVNTYPAIVLPVDTSSSEYSQLLSVARDAQKDNKTEAGETTTDSEGNESTLYYLYLWYDFDEEVCSFDALNSDDEMVKAKAQEHLLMKFRVEADDESQYFPDNDNNKLYSLINLDGNGDNVATVKEKETAYANARFYVNLINSGELNYKVTNIFEEAISSPAKLESLVNGDFIAVGPVLIATILSIVAITLFIGLWLKLGSITILTNTLLSLFVGACSVVWFSAEFSLFGIVALIAVALASITSGVVYCWKLKEEAYKGRTLKKANAEAAKKSTLAIVDINVALILIGALSYVFGGTTMRTFAAITVIGGLASIALNLLLFRGMMWLLTNATCMINKYSHFGITESKVPNLINEEKQSYFGENADVDFTAKKKPAGIAALVLFVASVAGLITFTSLNGGQTYRGKGDVNPTQIYVETTTSNSALSESFIRESILSNMMVYEEGDKDNAVALNECVESFTTPQGYCEIVESEDVDHYFFVITLDKNITEDWNATFKTDEIAEIDDKINVVLSSAISELDIDSKATMTLKTSRVYKDITASIKIGPIVLGTAVAIAITVVYLSLRYGLSRGLATLALSVVAPTIILGVVCLTRLPVTQMALACFPLFALFSLIVSIVIANRDKEMFYETKNRDNSVEARNELSIKSTASSSDTLKDLSVCMFILGVLFFAMTNATYMSSSLFATIAVGCPVIFFMIRTLLMPIAQFFFKLFKRKGTPKKKKSKGNKNISTQKSAEPEEAVFIGIND